MAQTAPNARVKEHLQALAKSIRAGTPCRACAGSHELRCNVCHGKGKGDFQCGKCGGSGRIYDLRSGTVDCNSCGGQGKFLDLNCPKCKATGKLVCKAKGCTKPVPQPAIDTFCEALECSLCGGRGSLFDRVALPCTECAGVGLFLQPRLDRSKTIR